ncbi:Acetyl-CoA:oxalate CoA-transferase [Usitatibacter rugosus]|uniref:Acetyl-CoA:oxalate CoA-transferase n=1 Tax=Usitatibacter rugosus TaxID=2732067 RepID=A0A6M4GR47_9PROT|nr:CoA transferase [Usitatibacter rugosus]QJR09535.1 Acetyl-CoA:oxalate CoA-transferase [Usitatibacter rugosus]
MKPLNGVRIVSVEQFGAAPYGSMFLADLGAEVIKVENAAIGGDPARKTGPYLLGDTDSEYFQTWNMNKKSVTLDLRTPEGKASLEKLVMSAEVVLNNLRGDLPAKMGLDYAALSKLKPAIVCVHLSAYGRDNERASWPGYDYLMQAEAGLMHLTGEPDGPPTRIGAPSMIDHTTGLTAMVGLLSALIQARATGKGCDVDTCLFDAALHQLGYAAIWYLNEGYTPERQTRSAHFSVAPVQTFPSADGWIFVMCLTDKFWNALLGVLNQPAITADARFANQKSRLENRDALTKALDAEFQKHPTTHWLKVLGGVLPIAPVYELSTALDSPFLRATDMIKTVPHPARADLRVLANPIKINGKRLSQEVCSAPGADNAAIL